MPNKLPLALITAALLAALAACAGGTAEPTETAAPTPTPRPQPTAAPTAAPVASLTDADRSYMKWLAGIHGTLDDTGKGLIERWQTVEGQGAGQVSPEVIEEMASLAGTLEEYVDEVEGRKDVPAGVAEIHVALLNEAHHWEAAAPLLVEGASALSEGDEELFQEKGKAADEEIKAAVEARREMLEGANELLKVLQEESN